MLEAGFAKLLPGRGRGRVSLTTCDPVLRLGFAFPFGGICITGKALERRLTMANGQPQEIKVNFPPHLQGGAYSNNMVVAHTREEFVMDFMMVVPPVGTVTSRVIISPGHMKRMISALQDNVKKYEARFGTIQAAEEPKGKIGFQA
jgi:hypothetical protein